MPPLSVIVLHLKRFWHRLTEPSPGVMDLEVRQRIKLLSVLLLLQTGVLVAFWLGYVALSLPIVGAVGIGLGIGVTLFSLFLTRTGLYRAAPVIMVVGGYLLIWLMSLLMSPLYTATILNFFALVVFFCSLVYSTRITLLMVALCVGGTLLLPVISPIIPISPPLFLANVTLYLLISVVAYIRRQDWLYLQVSESRYRSLMDASTEIMIVHDGEGRILDVNSGFERLLGYTCAEVVGKDSIQLVVPADRERVLRVWRQAAAPVTMRVINKQQQILDIEVIFRTMNYQGVPAHIIIGRDITIQKRAEQARIENELRYEALFNQTADGVLIISLDGIILSVNQQAAAMLRCETADIIGRNYRDFMVELPQENTTTLQYLKAGGQIPIYERQFRRKDGTMFAGEVNAMLVRDADGLPLYLQSLVRDISVRKQMEDQKFELALQRERMRILQSFIDDASHYFRTPLTALKTGLYLLPRFAHLPDKQNEQLDTMNIQVGRLEQLLEDLLTVVRLEQESSDMTRNARVNVNKLLLQLLPRFVNETHEHDWKFIPCSQPLEVFGDRHRLAHALSNLLTNARKYTPSGGKITITTMRYDSIVVIEIRDTGIGIPAAEQPRIFDNFYRGDTARTVDTDSSGMGLPITLKIITTHRGIIRVFSAPGTGSIFQLALPAAGNWSRLTAESVAQSGVPQPQLGSPDSVSSTPI